MASAPIIVAVNLNQLIYHAPKNTLVGHISVTFDEATWLKLHGLDSSHPVIRVGEAQTTQLPFKLRQLLQQIKAIPPKDAPILKTQPGGSIEPVSPKGIPQFLPSTFNFDAYKHQHSHFWDVYSEYKSASGMYNAYGSNPLFGTPIVEDKELSAGIIKFMMVDTDDLAGPKHVYTTILHGDLNFIEQLGNGLKEAQVAGHKVSQIRVHPSVAAQVKAELATHTPSPDPYSKLVTSYKDGKVGPAKDATWVDIGTTDEGMQGVSPYAAIADETVTFSTATNSSATFTLNNVAPETLKYLTGGPAGGPILGMQGAPPYLHNVHPEQSKQLEENVKKAVETYQEALTKKENYVSQEYLDGYPYKWSSPNSNPYQDIIAAQAVTLHAQPPGYELQIKGPSPQHYEEIGKKAASAAEDLYDLSVNTVSLTDQLKKLLQTDD